jgi:hypothetical protein
MPKIVLDAELDGKKERWRTKTKMVGWCPSGSKNNRN